MKTEGGLARQTGSDDSVSGNAREDGLAGRMSICDTGHLLYDKLHKHAQTRRLVRRPCREHQWDTYQHNESPIKPDHIDHYGKSTSSLLAPMLLSPLVLAMSRE
jgi:hypothetical protein